MNNPKSSNPSDPKASSPRTAGAKSGPATPVPPAAPVPAGPVAPLFRGIDWFSFGITALVVFFGYWWTLAPNLTLEDCGELAVASQYAGVPHPPGYPVWTIYTWLWTLLPIANFAYRVALSSAFAGAMACGLVSLMVSRGSSMMMEGIADLRSIDRRWENALCVVSGLVAGLLIGYNGFMWSQAVIVEVYTLSVWSLTGVMACMLRWTYAPQQYRYLYLAFFIFGITFNNHQSLLVVAMGLEVAILAVQPRLGRDLFFWNSLIYFCGLIGRWMGLISVLQENPPLMIVYHTVGLSSLAVWIYLLVKTKIRLIEFARDMALVFTLGCVLVFFGTITHYVMAFYYPSSMSLKTGQFVLFNLFAVGVVGALIYLVRATRKFGQQWKTALVCGLAWSIGGAFYVYMALASMSNPPLNWGYPRTVQGFFHAFTRGQYERIHPTIGQTLASDKNVVRALAKDFGRYFEQMAAYVEGCIEEFNLVYLLLALLPFLFYKRMQPRERAWMIGLTAIYLTLSLFLLNLLNPSPDRQSRDLNKVFFTASHFMIAMGAGYGLALVGAYVATHYDKARLYLLRGLPVALGIAFMGVIGTFTHLQETLTTPMNNAYEALSVKGGFFGLFKIVPGFLGWGFGLIPPYAEYGIIRFTVVFGLVIALAALLIVYVFRVRPHLEMLLAVCVLMPMYPIFSHWSDNEQRGHLFGYWFGHDMFTPSFKNEKGQWSYDAEERKKLLAQGKNIYPEMDRDTVLFGGTDPGRFNPTYMIFSDSFLPPSKKPEDPAFDRRDVYLITQNALADGTYLNYIRGHYNRSTQIDPYFFSELLRGNAEIGMNVETNIIARMMLPLDRFFTRIGDNIEKDRRAGSSFFKPDHFTDVAGLAARLRKKEDALSKFLAESLSPATQGLLAGSGNESGLRRSLAKEFNALLEQGPLYETNRFAHVQLSLNTRRFLAEDPRSHTRIRLNRILMEEAYPKEIARSLGGVYPDREIRTPSVDDSQRAFQEYLGDAQRRLQHDRERPNEPRQIRPGEDVRVIDNKVQVSGQVAVMAINGLLTRVIFDANPNHEFYVEESFPLDWMYPYLTPFGVIMKINRNPLPELTEEILQRDHQFWSEFSERLIGNIISNETPVSAICEFAERVYLKRNYDGFKGDRKFVRDNDGQKAFSKLRSSIAGVFAWRVNNARTPAEQQRMFREAEFAFKQAYAYCPYSPEAIFRYINLLIGAGRAEEALLLARTSHKLDPYNGQLGNLVSELQRIKTQQGALMPPPAPAGAPQIAALEAQWRASPTNLPVAQQLVAACIQAQQQPRATEVLDQLAASPQADGAALLFVAQMYHQLNQLSKVEDTLSKLVKVAPDNPEAWFDLAGLQAMSSKETQAMVSLGQALDRSAQRMTRDPNALNLYSNVLTDPRFASLRQKPEFQKVLEKGKPAGK